MPFKAEAEALAFQSGRESGNARERTEAKELPAPRGVNAGRGGGGGGGGGGGSGGGESAKKLTFARVHYPMWGAHVTPNVAGTCIAERVSSL